LRFWADAGRHRDVMSAHLNCGTSRHFCDAKDREK
jgi:hypothetical protein